MIGAAVFFLALSASAPGINRTPAEQALDAQDRAKLEQIAAQAASGAGQRSTDSGAQYEAALAQSTLAQLAIETGDKRLGRTAAGAGIQFARKAIDLKPGTAEYHRILGTLCGQVIPANVLAGLKWGRCAADEVKKAAQLNPKSAKVWLSQGVGNYYLPASFGGGVGKAVEDLRRAIQLDPKLAEAHLWLGVALRKAGKNPEARQALEKSLALNPNRKWAKQQLERTPAQ